MKVNTKYYFPSLVIIAVITIVGMPVPVLSGGSVPKNINSISDGGKPKVKDNIESAEMVICPEPRPQMCTMDYRPVCAQLKDGSFKTYANACSSCSDPNVSGYREGACEKEK